jgi:hypothetical protein
MKPDREKVDQVCEDLQHLERERVIYEVSKRKNYSRILNITAGGFGYESSIEDKKKREKLFEQARVLIKAVVDGEEKSHPLCKMIQNHMQVVEMYDFPLRGIKSQMKKMAESLHVTDWVNHVDQCGFGLDSLAIVIGEAGDLFNYSNPAKLWKRFGLMPYCKEGIARASSSWKNFPKKGPKLETEDWIRLGYSPRRRSVAYLVGENLCKLNGKDSEKTLERKAKKGTKPKLIVGPYRARFEETKAKIAASHPEYTKDQCNKHGMLLATKLLIKNLWVEWWDHPVEIKNW